MQERGLKFIRSPSTAAALYVAPYAGAWIEIATVIIVLISSFRRSLCRSVD